MCPQSSAEALNGDCHSAALDRAALQRAMQAQGEAWYGLATERCPYLFADVAVFITAAQMRQMRDVIDAVERVVKLPGWQPKPTTQEPTLSLALSHKCERGHKTKGVFFGYDFHLNNDGAHLIEINTNAGGGFLVALVTASQREFELPGTAVTFENLEESFLDMFLNEWRLARGKTPLNTVAIVDEQPESQYLYPEFQLAQRLFERSGIAAYIVDSTALDAHNDGVYLGGRKIDMVYNRLTDFSLQQHPALLQAYLDGNVVLTPDPSHYARYADKRNLVRLTDTEALHALGANEADIAALQAGIPHTIAVRPDMKEMLWSERKQWFFKPNSGYGGKGTYRGDKLTTRVFAEILQSDYVAQKLAPPGERSVCVNGGGAASLKYDVRCFVYDGRVQLVAARLYQGQTTNFRTPGGGFALVRVVE